VLAAPCLIAACSELIPGLNVRMENDGHDYHVTSRQDGSGYEVVPASSANGGSEIDYRIVPITPGTIVQIDKLGTEASDVALPTILPSDIPAEYQLGAGDIVYVTVWDHPELTSPYSTATTDPSVQAIEGRLIAPDGMMFYPYVGAFKVSGMTPTKLREYLQQHLTNVLAKPQIDVRVVAFRAHRIEVTGEVVKPGTVNLDDTPKGILQAIALTGGLTTNASRRSLTLTRDGKTYLIDLGGLLSGERGVPNPEILAGDVIHVPDQSGDQIFVLGAVTKQQQLPMLQDSTSLIQALTQAGGLDALSGKQSGVFVFRTRRVDSKLTSEVFTLDLSHPAGILLASQFRLQPRDVVYVQATRFSQYNSIINELLPTVTTIYELNALHQFIK